MADFKYNPDTDEYEYVGNGYEGVPEATVDPDVLLLLVCLSAA